MNHTSVADKWKQKRLRHSHQHPLLMNVSEVPAETLTPGQRVADRLAIVMGSWTFMIVQSIILAAWIALNIVVGCATGTATPLPANLALNFQAASPPRLS